MNDGVLGKVLGQLGDTAKKTGESLIKVPKDLAEAAAEQGKTAMGSQTQTSSDPLRQSISEASNQGAQSNQDTKDVVASLYSKSGDVNVKPANVNTNQQNQSGLKAQIADKPPEEQKEILELQQKLHKETYYDPTFNPVKNPPAGGEERPAEKVENEKKKEMQELKKKEQEKPPPLAVQRAQNKAEMFRGAAG